MTYHPTDADDDGDVEADVDNSVTKSEDAVMSGLTLESGDTLTIPSDYSMVVGEQYDTQGSLTVDGNLTVVDNEDEKPPVLDSTTGTLTGGSSPALDLSYTTTVTDASNAMDVIVSPQSPDYAFSYEYNYDVSIGYDGSNVTIGVTVNWDTDPKAGNDVGVDIEVFNRER